MPDGDRIHDRLSGRYQRPYMMLCEQFLPNSFIARELAQRVKRDLADYGDEILCLLQRAAVDLEQARRQGSFMTEMDWLALRESAGRESLKVEAANKRGLGLALRACHEVVGRLQHGDSHDDMAITLMTAYISHVYRANFQENAPLVEQHPYGIDGATFECLLDAVWPHVEREIAHFACQIASNNRVAGLRLRARRGMNQPVGLYDDLSKLGQ